MIPPPRVLSTAPFGRTSWVGPGAHALRPLQSVGILVLVFFSCHSICVLYAVGFPVWREPLVQKHPKSSVRVTNSFLFFLIGDA